MSKPISRSLLVLATLLLASPSPSAGAEAPQTYDLRSRRKVGQIDRVEASLEAGGELIVSGDPDHEKPPMSVVAKLDYDEKTLQVGEAAAATLTIRHYDTADATIKVSEIGAKPALREPRRLIGAATDGRQVTLFSPNGPLTRDELDLLDVLGSSILFDRLLPDEKVALKATWAHDDALMAALFGLEEVTANDVTSTLGSVTENSAIVEMAGSVEGTIGGADSALSMKAKYRFDFRNGRINWVGIAVHEKRTVGHALQGFDLTARLQVQILPKAASEPLSPAALGELSLEPTPDLLQLSYESPGGGWQFNYDRRWFVISDEHDHAVLQLVDDDQAVSRCTVSPLPDLPQGKDLPLEQFQEEIKRALGENFGQFVRAGQWAGAANYRLYRVGVQGMIKAEVGGKPAEVPIEWRYFRVADEHGRQVVFAFTVEEPMVAALAESDKAIVETLRFAQRPAGGDPQPSVASKQAKPEAEDKDRQ